MKKSRVLSIIVVLFVSVSTCFGVTSWAGAVMDYDAGSGYVGGYTNPEAAIGALPTDTGEFMGMVFYVTPFNGPYSPDDIVSVGRGGYLTLALENYALATDGFEIGIFSYQQFNQDGWPDGGTNDPVALFRASQKAVIEVSANGTEWVALNGGDVITCDIPASAFSDIAGTVAADFGSPFTGLLSDFDGQETVQDVLNVYGGSAGGTWVDISGTGLDYVGFIRFLVPEGALNSFELEGVSVATGALGDLVVVPEPCTVALLGLGGLMAFKRRKD